jgi:hypothetical protein
LISLLFDENLLSEVLGIFIKAMSEFGFDHEKTINRFRKKSVRI